MLNKIIHTYWTRLLATAMVFVSVVLTSRYLGADGKGLTSLITTNVLFINLVNEMVGGVSLIYLIPRRKPLPLLVPTFIFTLVNSLVFTSAFDFMMVIPREYSFHLYALAVLQTLNNTLLYVLLGKENVKEHNYFFLLKALINAGYLAAYFVVLNDSSVQVFIHALYVSNGMPLVIGIVYLMPYLKENLSLDNLSASLKEMVSYSSMAQFANIIQTLNYRLSFYLLNAFISKGAVGVYSVALALCDVVWMMSKSIGTVQLTRIANSNEPAETHRLTKRILRFSILSTAVILIPAMVIPGNIYTMIFGAEFHEVKSVLLAMAPGVLIFSINVILANHFAGTGRYKINLYASLIGLAFNAAANILLIPKLGISGAAIAASLTYAAITFYTWLMFMKESSLSWKDLLVKKEDLSKLAEWIGWGRE